MRLVVESRSYQEEAMKPNGLWVSDESDGSHGWSSCCHGEDFSIGTNAFEVEVAEDANILTLTTAAAVLDFHRTYLRSDPHYMGWASVAERWQGIFISPYQWELRLSDVHWYYSWDCASGCIWDAAAVESVALVGATRELVPALNEGGA